LGQYEYQQRVDWIEWQQLVILFVIFIEFEQLIGKHRIDGWPARSRPRTANDPAVRRGRRRTRSTQACGEGSGRLIERNAAKPE